jgi:peptide/nickel transport system ATP-binding protein
VRLEVEGLTVAFAGRTVSALPYLCLEEGQIVGIAGESGSGKSIAATALLGLARRLGATVDGSIRLDGVELADADDSVWRKVRGRRMAMIFQSASSCFSPVLRLGVTFDRAQALHGERSSQVRRRRAAEALDEVLLPARVLELYPHQLSGGQVQRVAIALALTLRAEVLLADEPTSALDVTVQAEILDLLRRLQERDRLAVLFISHDLGAIAEISERLLVMRSGEVVEQGLTRDVLARPRSAYTRELVSAVPALATPDDSAAEGRAHA